MSSGLSFEEQGDALVDAALTGLGCFGCVDVVDVHSLKTVRQIGEELPGGGFKVESFSQVAGNFRCSRSRSQREGDVDVAVGDETAALTGTRCCPLITPTDV